MEKISIIIPTYNSRNFIDRTLKSALSSPRVNIEIIVVDDCSTDGTFEYIKNIYPTVKIYRNKVRSGGPNEGRNKGLVLSTGNWINFLDHDDVITSFKIIKQLECAELYNVGIVSSSYRNRSSKGDALILSSKTGQEYFGTNETFRSLINWDSNGQKFQLGSLLIKKSICPIFTTPSLEYDFVFKLFWNHESAAINYCGLERYIDGNNLSLNINYKEDTYQMYNDFVNTLESKYKKDIIIGKKIISGVLARNYYYHYMKKPCRTMLLKSNPTLKNIWLYITSFNKNLMRYTINKFNILGK